MRTFVITQRTGFCSYFWTGHGFAAKLAQAEPWRTRYEASVALKKLKRVSPAYATCEVEEHRT